MIYLALILITPLFPILLSFDKRVHFVSNWKHVILAALIIAVPYIVWDIWFTEIGVWGFNPNYLAGIYLGNLPIEEVSFFIVVPFACTFIYACLREYLKEFDMNVFNRFFYPVFLLFQLFVLIKGIGGWYSVVVGTLGILVTILVYRISDRFQFIPLAFLFSLAPFLLINGVLTGSGLDEPIVWYNALEFSQLRILTIPIEDIIYAWGLIASNILLFEYFSFKSARKAASNFN